MAIRLDEARLRLLKMYGELSPSVNNTYNIGTSSLKFANIYATTFHGALDGNANTATALTSSAGSTTQPIYFSNGKPVAVTLKDTCNNLLNTLDIGSSTPVDTDYYISQYVGGGTTTTTYHRRPMSALYSYIKGKAEGTWNNSISGNAATATKINYPAQLTTDDAINNFNEVNKFQIATWNNTSSPGISNGIIMSGGWSSTSYGWQIAIDDDPTWYIALRQRDGNGWKAWKRIPMADGTGASGSWGISITGNAATASKVNNVIPEWSGSVAWADTSWIAAWNADGTKIKALSKGSFAAANHTHSYLSLSGGTMDNGARISHAGNLYIGTTNNAGWIGFQDICSQDSLGDGKWSIRTNGNAIFQTCKGAVWNDYAEYRSAKTIKPGTVVREDKDGIMKLTTERLMPACEIISDTFGFAIGETDECKTPIAAAGRVLAYTYEDRYSFELGDAVCSGPNGTVSKMTRQELMMYPERMIGTVSEIPEYKTWGSGNVEVDGRIWIRVR